MTIQIFKGVQNQELVLKADYDKLAAECAALRKFIDQSCYAYDGDGSDICDSYVDAKESVWFPKTPTIEAAIADLNAQGVEKFKVWNDAHIEAGDEYEEPLREVSKACYMFAANLRAGVKNA